MMTTRERREARADRLDGWAATREAKQHGLNEAARGDEAATGIPFGQPILVGHHSERRHRNAIARMDRAMGAAVENGQKAREMAGRADTIRAQAAAAIYTDDDDAAERLTEKIAKLEAKREQMKAANAEYRKAHKDALKAMTAFGCSQALPFPSYALTNLGATIRTAKGRLADIESGAAARRAAMSRTITARYGGECGDCGAKLERGDTIRYDKTNGARCAPECSTDDGVAVTEA